MAFGVSAELPYPFLRGVGGEEAEAGFQPQVVGGKRCVSALSYPVITGFAARCCTEGSPLVFQLLERLKAVFLEVGLQQL